MMKTSIIFASLFVVLFLLQFFFYSGKFLDSDESYFILASGDFVENGMVPYKDYKSDPKPPGIYYALGSLFAFTGTSVFAARVLLFVVNALAAVSLYFLAERISKNSGKFASLFYLAGMIIPPFAGYNVITEPFLMLFTIMSFYFLFSGSSKGLFLSGILGGASLIFKQISAVFLIAAFAFILLEAIKTREARENSIAGALREVIKKYLFIVLGFIIVPAIVAVHFYSLGALEEMIYWTITVPSNFSFGGFSFLVAAVHVSFFGFVWLLAVLRLVKLKFRDSKELSLVAFGVLSLVPWFLIQFGHYLLPAMMIGSVLAAVYLAKDFRGLRSSRIILVFLVVAFVITLAVNIYSESNLQKNSAVLRSRQAEVADFISARTVPDEKVYVFGYEPSVYLLSGRRPPIKSFHIYRDFLFESEEEVISALENVSYVVKTSSCSTREKICNYILNNYDFESNISGVEIYSRKIDI